VLVPTFLLAVATTPPSEDNVRLTWSLLAVSSLGLWPDRVRTFFPVFVCVVRPAAFRFASLFSCLQSTWFLVQCPGPWFLRVAKLGVWKKVDLFLWVC